MEIHHGMTDSAVECPADCPVKMFLPQKGFPFRLKWVQIKLDKNSTDYEDSSHA
jgi:hypothetical protein